MTLLTFFYIVEPPNYQVMACLLLASIRSQFAPDVAAVGYCPEHRMAELDPAVLRAHALMGSEIRPMRTDGLWDTPYPHGNKIIAALQPRESTFSAFVDSDVLFIKSNDPANLVKSGHVSCSAAASMLWAEQSIWEVIYGAFDMAIPQERIRLMRQKRPRVIPYFSAGLVIFPERLENGSSFPQVWYETARRIDRIDGLDKRRPYLDQMALPLSIKRAGLNWNILPEAQHHILGGRRRGKPLPEGHDIFTLHYRRTTVLRETGMYKLAQRMLKTQTGERYVCRLAPSPAESSPKTEESRAEA